MAQHQPGQHNDACRQQRRDNDQDQNPRFARLHGADFRFPARVAPHLERLHIVIKLLCYRNELTLQQIVIAVCALFVQRFQHWVDPLLVIGRQTGRHLIQQLLSLGIGHACVDHAFQRFLRQGDLLINAFHRFRGIVQQTNFHHSDSLARLVARTKDQRIARIELHHLLTLKVVDALK